ncbi:MAG: calcium-translocating P-type ATPase, PMCA-type [Muribaculaceae bacterium]
MTETKTTITGLTSRQVEENRRLYGANVLTPPPKPSLFKKFIGCFNDPLIKILLVALLLSVGIAVYEYSDGIKGLSVFLEPLGILIAVMLATLIGFWLEVSAEKKFDILNRVNDDLLVKVIRDGHVTRVPRRDIVRGDIVVLDSGDEVPADGHLIDSISLTVNESTLTGEPIVNKSHFKSDADSDATYPTDALMRGTTVVEGRAVMEVTAVGDATEYGKVYEAAQIDTGVKTPLTLQFERLGRLISTMSYVIGALIVVGRCLIFDWGAASTVEITDYLLTTLMLAITLIVVSVPEGLPMSVTLSLALSMRRMLASNNLVRKLHACETMGATTVICTDKTGTLTRNRMSVAVTDFYDPETKTAGSTAARIVDEAIAVNSTAFLEVNDSGTPAVVGNPTEGAMLTWLFDRGIDYLKLREEAAVVDQLPFSTQRKYMATVVISAVTGRRTLYVKGAPEIVLDLCASVTAGVTRESIAAELASYQAKAMRTLGFAYAFVDDDSDVIADGRVNATNLVFMGVAGIADPVREDVPAAIRKSIDSGINIKIVTGDTPGTAKEIGRQVGLWSDTDSDEGIITGTDWAALDDDSARQRAKKLKIMARARPTDKARLVRLLQDEGEVVAVTGDGTNDAPALNAAQVGLSMGDGTAVAKEASDITIIDNSFASITKAVMWGRSLYQNIRRFILFQLTVNLVASLTVVAGAFTGTESPLTVTQMLWVNLIMDTFAALALASLPPSEEVMNRPPRRQNDFIISRPMYTRIIGVGLLFTVLIYGLLQYLRIYRIDSLTQFNLCDYLGSIFTVGGDNLTPADLTILFTFFVFLQFWNLFNARAFDSGHSAFNDARHSLIFFATLGVIIAGQFLIVYVGGEMFNVVALPFSEMLTILAVTSPVMLIPLVYDLIAHALRKK